MRLTKATSPPSVISSFAAPLQICPTRTRKLTRHKRSVRAQHRTRGLIWGRATNRVGRFGLLRLTVSHLLPAAVEGRVAHYSVVDQALLQRQLLQDGRAGYTHDRDGVRQAVRGNVPLCVLQRPLVDVWRAATQPSGQAASVQVPCRRGALMDTRRTAGQEAPGGVLAAGQQRVNARRTRPTAV